jgi:aminomethyltransferase
MIFAPLASMGIRRIEAGILDNGSDMDWSMTPFAAGLGDFVDMEKPGFIGRAALQAADRGRRLWGLRCAAAAPARDCRVLQSGAPVGRITTGAWSPFLNCGIGYVAFDFAGEWLGQTVTLQLDDGTEHPAETVPLPFYDAEKRIPRGLDRTLP